MPRVPWKWIALGLMTAAVIATAYVWNERSKVQALRAAITNVHTSTLQEATKRYETFRDDLVQRVLVAGRTDPVDHADDQVSINGLRKVPGLYLRIPRAQADSAEHIAAAAAKAEPDVVATCIGLAPLSARGLFELGSFLLPEWLSEARSTDSLLRLRVIEDDLARRVKRDLPSVMTLLQARWLLLLLEHGPRDRSPVDVFLYDLRETEPLLQARIQARGILMSARARFDAATAQAPRLDPSSAHRSGAVDCSIGSQIKAIAGSPAAVVSAQQPSDNP